MAAPAPFATTVTALLSLSVGALVFGAIASAAVRPAAMVDSPRPVAAAPAGPDTSPGQGPPATFPNPDGPAGPVSGVRFWWPLSPAPTILRRFDPGPLPWSPGHRGVDLAGIPGAPVLAAGTGIVIFAGPVAGRGVVVVDHGDGLRTTYEPVLANVHHGDQVATGQRLGELTGVGAHCAPTCLHWGARRGEAYLDPVSLIRPHRPPVLLPLAPRPADQGRSELPPGPSGYASRWDGTGTRL